MESNQRCVWATTFNKRSLYLTCKKCNTTIPVEDFCGEIVSTLTRRTCPAKQQAKKPELPKYLIKDHFTHVDSNTRDWMLFETVERIIDYAHAQDAKNKE